jgi:hypothetical protein
LAAIADQERIDEEVKAKSLAAAAEAQRADE